MNYGKYKFEQAKREKESRVKFRGRELNNTQLGENVLNRFIESLEEISVVEKKPLLEGKTMFVILSKKV